MGLSASQGRLLLLTARQSDLEFQAQQISQRRLLLAQSLEAVSREYEEAVSNRQMKITQWLNGDSTNPTAVNNPQRSVNLTYDALISGSLKIASEGGSSISKIGLNPAGRNFDSDSYSVTSAYRLVTSDGKIVVADASEIPQVKVTRKQVPAELTSNRFYDYNMGNGVRSSAYNFRMYTTGEKGSEGNWTNDKKTYFAINAGSALMNAVGEGAQVNFDLATGVYYVEKDGQTSYYYANGDLCGDTLETLKEKADGKAFGSEQSVSGYITTTTNASSLTMTTTTIENGGYTINRNGNTYTLMNGDQVVAVYLVDPALKYGSTDAYGNSDGPNYIQDCIRNGRYLIQEGKDDNSIDSGFRWKNVTWDSISCISDQTYDDDDDAAKAKYDRIQRQVQNQDKKLEIELDNIETQRNAVKTEIDSIKKIISENVEKTYNILG